VPGGVNGPGTSAGSRLQGRKPLDLEGRAGHPSGSAPAPPPSFRAFRHIRERNWGHNSSPNSVAHQLLTRVRTDPRVGNVPTRGAYQAGVVVNEQPVAGTESIQHLSSREGEE
jgi:hypothetical protein